VIFQARNPSLLSRPGRAWLSLLGLLFLAIGSLLPLVATAAQSDQPLVVVGEIDGTITPVMARYVGNTIEQAERDRAAAVVFEMDTPGGLSSAMDDIIDDFRESEVPVIVYVAPTGARAASAGVFIIYAAQVAAMAPGTNIGSASPVFLGADGSTSDVDDTMTAKVTNDAVARIRNLAEQYGRNADWAESAVRDAANITADEALQLDVIEYIAPDLATLLNEIDGVTVELANGPVTLTTANARTTEVGMSWFERLLQFLANPTVGYIFLSLGMLGLFFELSNPGGMLPGIVGVIGILVGLVSLGSLPLNWAGVALMGLAFLLFVADVFLPSAGLLTAGGIAAFILGSFMLVDEGIPGYELSRWVVWTIAFCLAAFFISMGALALKTRFNRSQIGREGLIGAIGAVRQTLAPSGMVFAQGELWSATLDESTGHHELEQGKSVVVTGLDGLRLIVRPATEAEQRSGASVAVPPWGSPEPV
jgi:membrane-bound serine protease (ClpP class)